MEKPKSLTAEGSLIWNIYNFLSQKISTVKEYILAEQSASANFTSGSFDVSLAKNARVQLNCTGFVSADSTFKLQDSADGSNWVDMVDSAGSVMSITVDAGASTIAFRINGNSLIAKYIRIVYTANTNSGGTFTGIIISK